jgi:hypothetical protein
MTLLVALLGLLGFVVCVALPGWLAVQLLDDGDVLWRLGVGLALGVFGVPALAFLVAVTARTSVTPLLLVGLGLVLDVALAALLARRRGGAPA